MSGSSSGPGPSSDADFSVARRAIELGWVTKEEVERAVVQREATPGSGLLDLLPLTPQQKRDLVTVALRPLPAEVAKAMVDPKRRVGKYVIVSQLGAGGMGLVMKAYDTVLCRWAALKFMRTIGDEVARSYFEREARLAAGLAHRNITAIHDFGEHDGQPYIAMQYIEGDNLNSVYRKMSRPHLLKCMHDVALAVEYAHQKGVIHRDLKPANIMLDMDGQMFVMDFGLAKQTQVDGASAAMSASSVILGTPEYMSPEQARGDLKRVDQRSDVYSLGATLYQILAGQPPLVGETRADTLVKILQEEARPLRLVVRDVPPDLDTLVMKCLEKDPSRRYQSALELANDLHHFLNLEPISARSPSLFYRLRRAVARNRLAAAAIVVLAIGIPAAGVVLVSTMLQSRADQEERKRREEELRGQREAEKGRIDRLVQDGDAAYTAGDWKRTYAAYQELLRLYPREAVLQERFEEAERELKVLEYNAGRKARVRDAGDPSLMTRLAELPDNSEAWEHGLQLLDEALKQSPNSDRFWYERGRRLFKLDRHAEAEKDFARACRLNPRFAEARYWRAKALGMLGATRAKDSREEYEQVVAIAPESEIGVLSRATLALEDGSLLEAIETLTEAEQKGIGKFSEDLFALRGTARMMAWVNDRHGTPTEALKDFQKAASLGRASEVRYLPAIAYLRFASKDLAGAERDYTRAIEAQDGNAELYSGRGQVREAARDVAGALADYAKCIELDPEQKLTAKLFEATRTILIAVEPDRYRPLRKRSFGSQESAQERQRDIARHQARLADAYAERAAERHKLGDTKGALEDLDLALAKDPEHEKALADRAWLVPEGEKTAKKEESKEELPAAYRERVKKLGDAGDWEGALVECRRGLQKHPKDVRIIEDLVLIHSRKPDLEAIVTDSSTGLAIEDRNSWLYIMRGWARSELGKSAEALRDLDMAVLLDPKDFQAWEYRAYAKAKVLDHAGALKDYDQAVERKTDSARLFARRGGVRLSLGDVPGGRTDFEKSLNLEPDNISGLAGLGRVLHAEGRVREALDRFRKCEEMVPAGMAEYLPVIMACEDKVAGLVRSEMVELPPGAEVVGTGFDEELKRVVVRLKHGEGEIVLDGVSPPRTVDSATGVRFTTTDSLYQAEEGGKWTLVRSGRALGTFDGIGSVDVSKDGRCVAYAAREGEKWFVVINGERQESFDWVGDVVVSPSGLNVAYVANSGGTAGRWRPEGGRTVVISRGERVGEHEWVEWLRFAPDGETVTYAAVKGEKQWVVAGATGGAKYDHVGEPVWSPDGKSLAYTAREGETMFIVRDGRRGDPWTWVGTPKFSADGKKCAWRINTGGKRDDHDVEGGRYAMVVDGKPGDWYEMVGSDFEFVGDRVVYRANTGGKETSSFLDDSEGGEWRVVEGDKPGPAIQEVISLYGAPDGTSYAYVASRPKGDRPEILLVRNGAMFSCRGIGDVQFSRDGKLVAFESTHSVYGGHRIWAVHLDGRRIASAEDVLAIRFSADRSHLAFVVQEGRKLVRKSLALPR